MCTNEPTLKTLNFEPDLEPLIRSGAKTRTWQLENPQKIRVGDDVLLTSGDHAIATVRVVATLWTNLGWAFVHKLQGHERYQTVDEACLVFARYYNREVIPASELLVIDWDVLILYERGEGDDGAL
jgi:hypothetical protein